MAKEKSNLINLTSNLSSFSYSKVGEEHYNTDVKRDVASERGPSADANYEKFSPDDGQFIQKKPGERYIGSNVDAGFVRGGIATKVQRQAEDQERIGKFLTTPKGALFTIKQAILQNQNADRETNIYNPLSLNSSLIDTLTTRPQRHINEVTSPFSSLGNFFRFLSGTNTSEQGRKNGNSISNNRNITNLKPDVDTFGGNVEFRRDRTRGSQIGSVEDPMNELDEAVITNKNGLVPFPGKYSQGFTEEGGLFERALGLTLNRFTNRTFTDNHGIPEKTAEFLVQTKNLKRVRNADPADLNDHDTVHDTLLDTGMNHSNLHIHERRGEPNSQEKRNLDFEAENNELIGDNTTSKEFSVIKGSRFKNEAKANKFFDIKSKGTRKLQVKYGGALGDPSVAFTGKGKKFEDSYKLPEDFIKFRIRDVVNGRWIIFPAIFTAGITDNSQATYNPINYIGRADAVHIYQNRTRSISFGFRVVALNEEDIPVIWEKMNYLKGLTLPQYKSFFSDTNTSNNTRPVAPIINLTIGDMFVNTPGYFTSVSVNVANSSTWETKDGRQFPHVCDVSVEFTHIGKEVPSMLGKHYDGAERVPTTAEREILNAEAEKRKQDFLAEAKRRREENIDAFVDGFNIATFNVGNFGTEFSNQYPGKKPLLNVVPDRLGTRTQPLSEHTINIGSLNATGASNRQLTRGGEDQAAKSALFVDKVRPLSKFGNFDTELLTPKQQKVKSDVMKATGGTGIL